MSAATAPLLRMQGISKSYGGVQALKGVDFEARSGEITCLLGENGAGKSTLMKILAGVVQGFEGSLFWEGKPLFLENAANARQQGIGVVFQEFNLCPNLSSAENIFIGREPKTPFGTLDRRAMREEAKSALASLDIELDLDLPVSRLGMAQQQMVEIARALSEEPRLLILDEPTSALSSREVEVFFKVLNALKARGLAIIYISHKLSELRELCDRVLCLRDGENAGEANPRQCSEGELVAMMVGRALEPRPAEMRQNFSGEPLLSVKGLCGASQPMLKDISFNLARGEILGVAGLMGAGRTELARLLIGQEKKSAGQVTLAGRVLSAHEPHEALEAGIAYVPEDRKTQGLIRGLSVSQHISLSAPRRVARKSGIFRRGRSQALSRTYIRRLRIKASGQQQAFQLSGGNQQKVILARCLASQPKVLILDEPTRGIDVGAKAEVHRLVLELAARGMAVILISSEMPELLLLSGRILVMHEGRLSAELSREQMSEEAVMKAAVGL